MSGIIFGAELKKLGTGTEPDTWVVTFSTQELDGDQVKSLALLKKKYAKVYVTDLNVLQPDVKKAIDDTELVDPTKTKTPGQRLRNQLWRIWKDQKQDEYANFDDYYKEMMEAIIAHYKKIAEGK